MKLKSKCIKPRLNVAVSRLSDVFLILTSRTKTQGTEYFLSVLRVKLCNPQSIVIIWTVWINTPTTVQLPLSKCHSLALRWRSNVELKPWIRRPNSLISSKQCYRFNDIKLRAAQGHIESHGLLMMSKEAIRRVKPPCAWIFIYFSFDVVNG